MVNRTVRHPRPPRKTPSLHMVAENTIMTVVWGRQGLCSYRELPSVAPRSRLAGRESVSSAERTPEPVSSEAPDGFGQGTVHAPFTNIGIVGIGAWAEGLAAFTKLLGPLPRFRDGLCLRAAPGSAPYQPLGIVPRQEGTALPVIEASAGMVLAPNHIDIIPRLFACRQPRRRAFPCRGRWGAALGDDQSRV